MLVHPPVCQFVFPPVVQVFFLDSSGQTRRLCQINTKWWAWPWLGALSGAGVRVTGATCRPCGRKPRKTWRLRRDPRRIGRRTESDSTLADLSAG